MRSARPGSRRSWPTGFTTANDEERSHLRRARRRRGLRPHDRLRRRRRGRPIANARAGDLEQRLDEIQDDIDAGLCDEGATKIAQLRSEVDKLDDEGVGSDVQDALGDGVDNLGDLARDICEENEEPVETTPETTPETIPEETTPETTPEPEPTTPEPEPTTPVPAPEPEPDEGDGGASSNQMPSSRPAKGRSRTKSDGYSHDSC